MAELVSLDEAIRIVLAAVTPLGREDVALTACTGRFLVEPAAASTDLPPFASSAMDGYALRASDTPGTLPISARVAAGRPALGALAPGTAAEISTGGVVPEGADAVVPIERVSVAANAVDVPEASPPGAHVRPRGLDVRRGDVVVESGTKLGAVQIGALAAAGIANVRCGRRPRVAIITTGSELREPGTALGPGEIYESNGRLLAALLQAENAEIVPIGIVADDGDAHRLAIGRALDADVVVTSGGVSVGPHDLVRETLSSLGVVERFWGIAMRPGKPVSFGLRGTTLVFGLPGNPVASLVGGLLLVLPALRALQGAAVPEAPSLPAALVGQVERNALRDDLLRGVLERDGDRLIFRPIAGQESHMIARASRANAIGRVLRGAGRVLEGSIVDVYPLSRPGA